MVIRMATVLQSSDCSWVAAKFHSGAEFSCDPLVGELTECMKGMIGSGNIEELQNFSSYS